MNKQIASFYHRITAFFFPSKELRGISILFFFLLFFKILWFDYSWCLISTFRPFSYVEMYIFGILLSLVLLSPFILFRRSFIVWLIDLIIGMLLLSNLLYFRTYYTAIPLSSYGLVDNLRDFTSSVYGSLRLEDVMFPVSTIVAAIFYLKKYRKKNMPESAVINKPGPKKLTVTPERLVIFGRYLLFVFIFALSAKGLLLVKGGFKNSYELLQDSYTHTCGTPLYTILGSAYYDYIRDKEFYTPETERHIEDWIDTHFIFNKNTQPLAGDSIQEVVSVPDSRVNCILILAESLESWLLEQTVEGQELMPYMNRLLQDSTTLYAPHVLSQVKGGRSIDAQLMINTGLLPINTGAYSLKHPYTCFPSLVKAMEKKHGDVYACILTADKPIVWNQNVMAPAFGYDSLLSKKDFIQNEMVGPHYRHQLGDVSLLKQCAEKIRDRKIWQGKANVVQIVTYSGHFPFVIPEYLKTISFSEKIPALMRDYMTVANYTDRALGLFVEALRSDPEYGNTLIVITGDHEGLADLRDNFCQSRIGYGVVSENPYTPLIIVNIPPSLRSALQNRKDFNISSDCMRYEKVMGQIDIYPTLLTLLGLTDYPWRGLGQSLLHPDMKGIAVDAHSRIYGDTSDVPVEYMPFLKESWKVSDEIIRYNYFSRK